MSYPDSSSILPHGMEMVHATPCILCRIGMVVGWLFGPTYALGDTTALDTVTRIKASLNSSLENSTALIHSLSVSFLMGGLSLPRPGETYKSPSTNYGLSSAGKGPFYNISVTLDKEALAIVEGWPKGTKSERIRWAIKDRYYGNSPQLRETIDQLTAQLRAYEAKQRVDLSQELTAELSAWARVLRLVSNLLGRRRGND